jgi:hypothetical protein
MTMALVAQAASDQLRNRLDPEAASWDARNMSFCFPPLGFVREFQPRCQVPVRFDFLIQSQL